MFLQTTDPRASNDLSDLRSFGESRDQPDIYPACGQVVGPFEKEMISVGGVSASAISRLPPELLAEIFLIISAQTAIMDTRTRSAICQVCSHWRHIAITTPMLWDKPYIRIQPNSGRFDDKMSLLRTWVDRAGELLLSISLHSTSTPILIAPGSGYDSHSIHSTYPKVDFGIFREIPPVTLCTS
jgi:hypothetical protein